MPDKDTEARAQADKEAGKSPSTQAGEFVREEFHHIREGKHGAKNAKQAVAIGLSKARRAGVDLPAPNGNASEETRNQAERDIERGQHGDMETSPKRARASRNALKKEGTAAGSTAAISRQSRGAARKRTASARSASARKAAKTRSRTGGSSRNRKVASTSSRSRSRRATTSRTATRRRGRR